MNTNDVSTEGSSYFGKIAVTAIPAAIITAAADILFWPDGFGVSVGVFFLFVAGMLLLFRRHHHPFSKWTVGVCALIVVSCVQSAIEISFSNSLVLFLLTLLLAGECFQPHLAGLWARWSEAGYRMITAPFRWLGLFWQACVAVFAARHDILSAAPGVWKTGGSAIRILRVFAPALILLCIFAAIFASGNAVFGELLRSNAIILMKWIFSIDLSVARVVFWGLISTAALGLFHSSKAPDAPRWWTFLVPRISFGSARLAFLQCVTMLVALNVLFCVVNTLDAAYLWRNYLGENSSLPQGVSNSEFVHNGVWSLIAAVILSAIVIAGMFQQKDEVVERRSLKLLAYLWILQNGVLVISVFLRLKLYVTEYQWTEKRVYVGCFLLLVGTGFGFLCWFVGKRKSFNWLLGQCALATCGTFFVLQFTNVAGYVARANLNQWKQRPSHGLDIDYLETLGPSAWPVLIEIAESPGGSEPEKLAKQLVKKLAEIEAGRERMTDWRSWQYRRASIVNWFIPRARNSFRLNE